MKVDKPRFLGNGSAWCEDCPYTDSDGVMVHTALCEGAPCPTKETYAEAVLLAEAELG